MRLTTAVADGSPDCPATASPLASVLAGDERQRWCDLPDADSVDAASRDRLATVADCQRKLAGNGWFVGRGHGGNGGDVVVMMS